MRIIVEGRLISASKWMELEDLNLAEERATQLVAPRAEAEADP